MNKPTAHQQAMLSTIKSKNGTELDKAYSRMMLQTELKAGNKTEKKIAHGNSQEVKQLAKDILPAIAIEQNMFQHAVSQLKAAKQAKVSKQ
jgi:hypothetical protein